MSALIDRDALIDEVMWRGGIRDRSNAEASLEAIFDALANHLPVPDRELIAERLSMPYAAAMRRPSTAAASRPSDLYAALATREEVGLGAAVEHARAACAGLAAALGEEARTLLVRRLPPDWSALFAPEARASTVDVPAGTGPGHGHTLATGRPGSSRPLAQAQPPASQPDSVATANPHGDRKLSSGEGSGPARDLATGRPGAEDPIAQARDERPKR